MNEHKLVKDIEFIDEKYYFPSITAGSDIKLERDGFTIFLHECPKDIALDHLYMWTRSGTNISAKLVDAVGKIYSELVTGELGFILTITEFSNWKDIIDLE